MPLFFIGLKYMASGNATLILNSHPIFVSVLAYYVLKEQITVLKVISAVGAFIGVALFTIGKQEEGKNSSLYGVTLVIIASILSSIVVL